MTIELTGRHMELTPRIRSHAEEKIRKLGRLVDSLDLHVKLEEEKHWKTVSIVARGKGGPHTAETKGEDVFAAINEAVDLLARQLRKNKTAHLADRRKGTMSIRHLSEEGAED